MAVWFAASVATIVLGFGLAVPAPSVGTILVVAGVLSLGAFLLYVFRFATTHDDQWVWQTPHKPRRAYLAEQAAKKKSDSTGKRPDTPG